jgi:hypothetical protein
MDKQLLCNQLIESIKDIFPKHAKLRCNYDGHRTCYICLIDWKLNRLNKRSKLIRIVITEEALDDYSDSLPAKQKEAQKFFKKHIESKYKQFDPNHEDQIQPNDWLVTTDIINK